MVVGLPVLLQYLRPSTAATTTASLLQGSNSGGAIKIKKKQAAGATAVHPLCSFVRHQSPRCPTATWLWDQHSLPHFPRHQSITWFEVQRLGGVVLTLLHGKGFGGGAARGEGGAVGLGGGGGDGTLTLCLCCGRLGDRCRCRAIYLLHCGTVHLPLILMDQPLFFPPSPPRCN